MSRDLSGEHAFIASEYTREREYWLNKLSGDWVKGFFPYDYKKTAANENESKTGTLKFRFPPELFSKITRAMNRSDSRLSMILTAALVQLINKYTGNEDIIVGTPIEKQDLEGEFVNTTLALRNSLKNHMTFRELLSQTRQTIVEASENQNYPIETLPYELKIEWPANEDFPLFDVVILLENIQDKNYLHNIHINLIFSFLRLDDALEGVVEYNAGLYEKAAIERITQHYMRLLQESLAAPDLKIADISLLSELEKKRLLIDFNNTRADYPREKTIHGLFRQQAKKTPDNTAVLEADGLRKISYRELEKKVEGLAGLLMEKGVKTGTIVPIMGQRKIEIVTGILGILKAGGAYLPVDATSPPDRIKFLLQDSSAGIILTQKHLIDKNKDIFQILHPGNIISLEDETIYQGEGNEAGPIGKPADPAYVIYTSGTTGKPKGVIISHLAAVNYITWAAKNYVKNEAVNFPLYSSISFDMTITSIFTPLITGNALVLYGGDYSQFLIEKIIEENRVGVIKLTPSHLNMMRDIDIDEKSKKGIKRFIVGGEELDTQLARDIHTRFDGNIEICNEYGPTEATVGCMIYKFNPGVDNRKSIPIGFPADNSKIYLLDKNQDPAPVGVMGEIYIAGDGIADGYLNRPELVAGKFITNPFASNERMYRSGDLGRWINGDHIESLGRIDHQVKIRGFRIEPGEIESKLLNYDGIKEALVISREDQNADKYLCAYIVPSSTSSPQTTDSAGVLNVSELRDYLSKELPDYMIPGFFVQLEETPLTPGGKVDRKALPEPEVKIEVEHIAPRNKIEEKLAEIWSQVLGIEKDIISIDANFFELGGHSLNATVLSNKMHKAYDAKVPLVVIFERYTIRRLAEFVEEAAKDKFVSIEPAKKKDYYILSSAQKRLYIIQRIYPEIPGYNIPIVVFLEGELNRQRLKEAFQAVIRRHESLRTSFEVVEGEPVQKIDQEVDFEIEYYETGEEEADAQVDSFIRFFDLGKAPLLRVGLVKIGENKHILMIDMHHIISDEISLDIFIKDSLALYGGEELPGLGLQYKDFAEWQNSDKQRAAIKEQETFWLKEFEEGIPVLDIPTDYIRPIVQSFEGRRLHSQLSPEEIKVLKEVAFQEGATIYMALLAIYNILLSKVSSQQDIVIGTPVAGRRHVDLEQIIGMFVNTLALKNYPAGQKTFKEFLAELRERTLQAFDNQEYQFEELVDKLMVERDASRNPLFDVMFVFQSIEEDSDKNRIAEEKKKKEEKADLEIKPYKSEFNVAKFDLIFLTSEADENLFLEFQYCTKLFKEETIIRLIQYLKAIISAVVENPERRISEIEILSNEEKNRILRAFNDTKTGSPKDKTIHQLFEEQVERTGDNIAIVCMEHGARGMASLTYRELNEKSNQLAHLLWIRGVRPGSIVGMMVERSIEMIVGILAILKVGGAYLPIELDYPEERIRFMLADSSARIVVSEVSKVSGVSEVIDLKKIGEESESLPTHPLTHSPTQLSSSNLAYIIYTSGTTGTPKGTLTTHFNVTRVVKNTNYIEIKEDDRVLQLSNYAFDGSVFDIYGALLNGSALVMIEREDVLTLDRLADIIKREEITVFFVTTALFNALVDLKIDCFDRIRKVLFGGERVSVEHSIKALEYLGKNRIIHVYGPTETTVYATYYFINHINKDSGTIPIGKPVSNTTVYILDKSLKPVPIGINGEVYIGGDGVAPGYLNRAGLTWEKFIANPFVEGERLYRTGDLARWLPDGNTEFIGRMDNQVKIRGFRIEPGEIEIKLLKHDEIKEAVVFAKEKSGRSGDKYLCGYIVSDREFNVSDLREYLSKELPDYMIPSYFVQVDKIPLTTNGKVNRKALEVYGEKMSIGVEYVAPKNEMEKIIAEVWKDVLILDKVGVQDNFFDIGGNSLFIVKANHKLKALIGKDVPLVDMFRYPTIDSFAKYLEQEEAGIRISDEKIEESVNMMEESMQMLIGDEDE